MATRKSVSHYNIMDYWRDKAICKNGEVITEDEAEKWGFVDTVPVIRDWGEPMCWGCSKPIISDYEKSCEAEVYDEDDIKSIWSDKKVKSKLNRCHVIPASLDGEDAPQNLFLMCESCHFLSPDTRNKAGFFRWVYRRRKSMDMGWESMEETFRLVDEELTDRGLPTYLEIFKQCPNIKMGSVDEFMKNRISTHGSKIVMSTFVVALADWFEVAYRKAMVEIIDTLA